MSPEKLKIEGLKALRDRLGAVGMAMFLRQFDLGEGDYTKERRELLKNYDDVDKIVEEIRMLRKNEHLKRSQA
jgi:hypothetical protein